MLHRETEYSHDIRVLISTGKNFISLVVSSLNQNLQLKPSENVSVLEQDDAKCYMNVLYTHTNSFSLGKFFSIPSPPHKSNC